MKNIRMTNCEGGNRLRQPHCPSPFVPRLSVIRTSDDQRRGAALIVVLWVVGLLAMLVGSLAFDAHIEARVISYLRKRTKADYLARSGIEVARLLMDKSKEIKDLSEDEESEDAEKWWFEVGKRLAEGLAIRDFEHAFGEGTIIIDIVPEPARSNVNLLGELDWERILEVSNVPEEYWPELIESFLDWLDTDEDSRVDGAETEDYYSTLDPPYEAKDGPLDTVGELLLVKGFTQAILSGGPLLEDDADEEEPWIVTGIEDLLTTYGDGKVNVNAASQRVLMTLPEVDEIVAGAIIEEREGLLLEEEARGDTSFENVNDFFARIPELDPNLKQHITTDSSIYRITSVGRVGGITRTIWCIAEHGGEGLTFLRWREE